MKNNDDILTYTAQPHIELVGNNECAVDGLKAVLEYTADRICIDLGKYCVTFYGDGLCINSFSREGAVVAGTIISVEFGSRD